VARLDSPSNRIPRGFYLLVLVGFSNGSKRLIDFGLLFFGPPGGFLVETFFEALDRGFGSWILNRSWVNATSSQRRVAAPPIAMRP